MKYVNAKDVLPADVLSEVQKYTCGNLIYIPKRKEKRAMWGTLNGSKKQVVLRNKKIAEAYRSGAKVHDLMSMYCLSEASIKKIIYARKLCKQARNDAV